MENKEQSSDEKIKSILSKLDRNAIIIGLVGIIFLFGFTIIATQYNLWFDFNNTGQIGDTIGGLTAPTIGIFSALLIYLSFRAQIQANYIVQSQIEKQEKTETGKKQIEFIVILLNQVREEINEFEHTQTVGLGANKQFVKRRGAEAIAYLLGEMSFIGTNNEDVLKNINYQRYKGLVTIFEDLVRVVFTSEIKKADKTYFLSQLKYLFNFKLYLNGQQRIEQCKLCGKEHINVPCLINTKFDDIKFMLNNFDLFE